MCGIIGYVGGGDAAKIVYDGLLALEYRGYDSAGIAIKDGERITTIKKLGRVANLEGHIPKLTGQVAIGHTRWATHGKPSDLNAHPHTSGAITLVHNGIIENYSALKSRLESEGKSFVSETDSEVVAALIDTYYGGNLLFAVQKAVQMLTGSYALLVMSKDSSQLVAVKSRSPLIIGLGEGENFLASDMPALASLTKRLIVLKDGDIAEISRDAVKVFDSSLNAVDRGIYPNEARASELQLGSNPHYMYKEMHESRATVERTAASFFEREGSLRQLLASVEQIVLTGCGTAYHAAMLGARYLDMLTDKPSKVVVAGELRYRSIKSAANTLLIAVTQSGETADTVEAARAYKERGAKILAVTNSPYSAISLLADFSLPVVAGSEICVAATKSYIGQIVSLYLLACLLCPDERHLSAEIAAVCGEIEAALRCDVELLAQVARSSKGVYFLGRNMDFVTAKEGSLKLKEVSYIPCEGYLASELKHGTLAIVDSGTLCIFIISEKALAEKSLNAVEQVLSRGGRVAVITTLKEVATRLHGRVYVKWLECSNEYLSPIVVAPVLQSLAYRTAILKGLNPDKPRNLAKSVTVE